MAVSSAFDAFVILSMETASVLEAWMEWFDPRSSVGEHSFTDSRCQLVPLGFKAVRAILHSVQS